MSYGSVPQRSPYGNNDPAFTESATGFINPQGHAIPAKKKGLSPWIKFGIPVALVVIIAAVVVDQAQQKLQARVALQAEAGK